MSGAPRIHGEVWPAHILARVRPEDRPDGVAGMLPAEVHSAAVAKAEKALQGEISRYLKLLAVDFINPPMNRKSLLPAGWPDFTFTYRGQPVTWECKAIGGSLRPEQSAMRERLLAQGWQWRLIRSAGEAKDHLREIEAKL